MPRRKISAHYEHMSEFETGPVIGLKEAGWSNRLIARNLCRNDAAIRRCWQKWVNNETMQRQDGSGRPRATTEREDRAIVRMAVAAPESTLSTIQRVAGTQVSKMTINRRLRERNRRARRPLRCLPLTHVHRQVRLQWCRKRSTWNCADWERIVFSDESRFLLFSDDRRKRVWRRPGQRGAISFDRRTPLVVIPGTLTAQRYVDDILRPVLLPFLSHHPELTFQQDNVRPHTARVTMDCLQSCRTLPWPARLPGLSPIEHIWDVMGRRLQPSRNVDYLARQVEDNMDCGRQGTSKQVNHCLYRKMEQGREEDSKEHTESDPDYESGENTTFPKMENTLGRTQEVTPSQENATLKQIGPNNNTPKDRESHQTSCKHPSELPTREQILQPRHQTKPVPTHKTAQQLVPPYIIFVEQLLVRAELSNNVNITVAFTKTSPTGMGCSHVVNSNTLIWPHCNVPDPIFNASMCSFCIALDTSNLGHCPYNFRKVLHQFAPDFADNKNDVSRLKIPPVKINTTTDKTLLSGISVCLFHLWPSCVAFHHGCTVELTSSWRCNLGQSLKNHGPLVLYRRKIRRTSRPGKRFNLDIDEEPLDNACDVWLRIIMLKYGCGILSPRCLQTRKKKTIDQVSEFDRGRIMAYRDCGLSFKETGSHVGRDQTTVICICDRWMQEGTTDRRVRSNRPQCTTSRADRQIVRMAVTDRSVTSRTVAQHIQTTDVSAANGAMKEGGGRQNELKFYLLTCYASVCNTTMVGFESEYTVREDAEQLRYTPPH
ncbi:hypothetical protein LAZ67_16002377 [Cordylochernes scorpioides]|uniref:Transposase Tc1-like domain-containing protein n=1 Tax=Cordylochernes scorpioides TaxID=51811 RepID=A0ABY6LCB0_9ARAC|nr:hypothetical protein LAZ67_16002377 [Cordylochernes scorpioides]